MINRAERSTKAKVYYNVAYNIRWLLYLLIIQFVHKNQTLDSFVNNQQHKVGMSVYLLEFICLSYINKNSMIYSDYDHF